jgi:drug/metabolite transporter (DMT)-like permease
MPILALALLLGAAVGHASWNFFAKGARSSPAYMFAFSAVAAVAYLPVAIAVYVWMAPSLGTHALAWVAVSGLIHIAYFVLLAEGYRTGDLSLVYPLARGTGPAIAVGGGILLFGDRPSPLAIAGSALIIAGVLVMSWSPRHTASVEVRRSVIFALATGAIIATYTLWDNQGVSFVTPVLYSWGTDAARVVWLAPLTLGTAVGRRSLVEALRDQRRAVLAVGILGTGAYIMVLTALTLAPVSYVAPAREVSILFGAILGWRLLGESDPKRRLAGATAIVAGVFALALG